MTGLPKFVRNQMAGIPAPSAHPDADILTAFVENTLPSKERQGVVEHLCACADCREVIFLAQPEAVPTQTVLAPKPHRFTRIAWASTAAVVVIVGSAVILQHEQVTKTQPPAEVATTSAPAPPEAKPTAPPTTSDEEAVSSITQPRSKAPSRVLQLDASRTKPLLATKDAASSGERESLKAPAPIVPSAVTNQQVIVAGAAPQQGPNGPSQRNIAGSIQQAQGPSNSTNNVSLAAANENLAKAEPAPAAKVAKKDSFHNLAAGYTALPAAAPVPAVRAHWQISSSGTLERSNNADNWTPVLSDTGTKFHVVSVIGNTVWAGGERGALYVSRDGGATWNGIAIDTTATITSVHFSDDSHGTIEGANGQAWKTADGGKTWQKQ